MRHFLFFFLMAISLRQGFGQTTGQVMFVGYNADGNDGFAFVTLVDLASGISIHFNDNEWNALAIGSGGAFNTGETSMTWNNNTGTIIRAGTVITINNSQTTPAASIGTVSSGTMNIANADEMIYMFLGTTASNPTTFLSSIATETYSAAVGVITNTGLADGTSAIHFINDEDVMVYNGTTEWNSTVAAARNAIANTANWIQDSNGASDHSDGAAPDFPTNVPCNFYGSAFGIVTYYSRASGNWDSNTTWTLISDGSGSALPAGIWPQRHDNVVILSGHAVTIDDTDVNDNCGLSPDDLNRTNVGTFTGSDNTMFYHTGNIIVEGTLNADVATMIEGYTLVEDGGSFSVDNDLVNLGTLEVSAAATFENIDDDLILSGNSTTIINNTAGIDDDIYLDWTNATLCGTGIADIDGTVQFSNGATSAQICSTFTIICDAGCGTTPSGTFISGNTGPGGIGNAITNQLWLRADALTLNDGDPVTTWLDASGNGLSAVQGTAANQPTFQTNDVNTVLPSISFDGGDFLNLGNPASLNLIPQTDSWSYFIVYNVPDLAQGTFFAKAQGDGATRQYQYTIDDNITSRFTSYIGGNATIGNVTSTNGWYVSSQTNTTTKTSWTNEGTNFTAQGVGTGQVQTTEVLIGARRESGPTTGFGFPLTGNIAEMALYDVIVNQAQRIIITNYLAAKYNIALSANDVYTMDNGANGNYDFEVAGIGQASDGSNHKDAKGSGLVRIWNPSGLGDSEFLMWGHNNGSLNGITTDVDGTLIEERLERVWRVTETGDVGTVSVSIDLSLQTGNPFGSELSLLIDRDGDGFMDNDETPVAGTFSATGDEIIFSGIDFQNDDRFTLGNSNLSFPLPIELISFRAEAKGSTVNLFWSTASETNNDYFTVERSKTATDWEVVVNIPGAGTSNQQVNYTTTDDGPYRGTSYYRLKQTDFDKQYSYSKLVRVAIQFEDELIVYPNPSRGTFTLSAPFKLKGDYIQVFDNLGRPFMLPMELKESEVEAEVDSGSLAPGMYIMQVSDGFEAKSFRIVIY